MSSLNATELKKGPDAHPVGQGRGSVILEDRKHISNKPTQSEKKSIVLFFLGGGEGILDTDVSR